MYLARITVAVVYSFLVQGVASHQAPLNIGESSVPVARNDGNDFCPIHACGYLSEFIPGRLSFEGSKEYEYEQSRYWSRQQTSQVPACRLSPISSIEVAKAIHILRTLKCPFAVKSGGHAAFAGASNIQGGVTIDLVNLNQITLSSDNWTASVGPGNRWINVYEKLSHLGLTVIGGRAADVGVGGLILGGGISFFSGRYGWALDNVRNYEVVLANGSIVQVNHRSHPDLYWALRGGGNNFGIVTRFDLETFPQGQLWGGSKSYNIDQNATLLQSLTNFNEASPGDPDAALIVGFAYVRDNGTYVGSVAYDYAKPEADPPIYDEFKAVPNRGSSMRVANLTDITIDFNRSEPAGYRTTYMTATFRNDAALLIEILEIFASETEVVKNLPDIFPVCFFQPITVAQMSHFSKVGGNALGISSDDGPLVLFAVATQWSAADDDESVYRIAQTILDRAVALAKSKGLEHRYIYQNYAASSQDIFGSYGPKNKARLLRVQEVYDPGKVFVDLQPGYFKLRPSTESLQAE